MDDREIRALSIQLAPLADDVVRLFAWCGVHATEGQELKPGYDHGRGMFTFGPIGFGNIRPRPGMGWVRKLGEPREMGTEPVDAVQRIWPNSAKGPIEVVLDEEVTVEDGVQSVKTDEKTWGSDWEVGGSVSTTLASETTVSASYMGVSAEQKLSASVTAEINAKKSGSRSGSHSDESTKSKTTGSKRGIHQTFAVPGETELTALATYDKTSLVVPYVDTLAIDVKFDSGFWYRGCLDVYHRYFRDWFGKDSKAQSDSLVGWFGGFFGNPPSGCDDFRPGCDITFSSWSRDTKIRNLLDHMRSLDGSMVIQRTGTVVYADAGSFRFSTKERPCPGS